MLDDDFQHMIMINMMTFVEYIVHGMPLDDNKAKGTKMKRK